MYCTGCGSEMGQNARFCSACGKELTGGTAPVATLPPVVPARKQRDWAFHVTLLGWISIANAAIAGLIGLTVMFGGQLARRLMVENPGLVPPDAPELSRIIGPVTFLIGLVCLLVALPSAAAGVGLLQYRSWGRILTIVVSVLRVLSFPFGTALSIYSFWVLLSEDGKNFYKARSAESA